VYPKKDPLKEQDTRNEAEKALEPEAEAQDIEEEPRLYDRGEYERLQAEQWVADALRDGSTGDNAPLAGKDAIPPGGFWAYGFWVIHNQRLDAFYKNAPEVSGIFQGPDGTWVRKETLPDGREVRARVVELYTVN
jgi:hypothetical protein